MAWILLGGYMQATVGLIKWRRKRRIQCPPLLPQYVTGNGTCGARFTNSRSGPRIGPKSVKIIPDKLCYKIIAGINKPFSQNANSYIFQD